MDLKSVKQEYQELRSQYRQLTEQREDVRKREAQCKSSVAKLEQKLQDMEEGESDGEEAKQIREGLQEMASTFPKPTSHYLLRMIIGDILVTLPTRDDKVTYKQNYEKFKMVNVVCICALSVISLLLPNLMLPGALLHCASVWYYFTVTLRELILISNGSRIKLWWLMHHYLSIVLATILLTWPPGECYNAFKTQVMLFTFCLTLVMGLQFRYQRAKLYREVAMGEKHHMTVSQEGKLSNLRFLLACLIGIYLFQLYNGYTLMSLYLATDIDCSTWQVPVLSVLFFVLAGMNCSTLSSVVYRKKKSKST